MNETDQKLVVVVMPDYLKRYLQMNQIYWACMPALSKYIPGDATVLTSLSIFPRKRVETGHTAH